MALNWLIPGQLNAVAAMVLTTVRMEGAVVPRIWPLEVANILGLKLRDGNLMESDVQESLGLLKSLDIAIDSQSPPYEVATGIGNIIRFQLAAYDGLYVELALRTGFPLATFDKGMIASARRYGISILGSE